MSVAPVFIAGAGPVGATLALALGQAGVAVALLDRGEPLAPPGPGDALDLRVSALSAGAVTLLENLGVWTLIDPQRRGPYRALEVWEDDARIHFDAADLGLPVLGAVVENRALVGALARALDACAPVRRLPAGTVSALEAGASSIAVHADTGQTTAAVLAVGAEGADSAVRTLAGIGARRIDFRHSALVTHVRTAQPHRQVAYQRFLAHGPLALLPLPDGRVSVVWSCPPAQAAALAELDETEFALALARASDWRLGEVLAVDRRVCVPLRGLRAARYVGTRVALAGDAAHVLHPLAGLGATLGLLDAATLAEVISQALARGDDPGADAVLRGYERARRAANAPVETAIAGLHWLYGVQRGPLPVLRRAGLRLAARTGPLKALIMAHASAQTGELPALARLRAAEPIAG